MNKTRSLLALGALIVVAGCATQPGGMPGSAGKQPSQKSPEKQPQKTAPPSTHKGKTHETGGAPTSQQHAKKKPPHKASEVSSPAVMSLLGSADTLAKAGRMDAAASTLERALNLDPRNPFIYQRLAAVRLAQGQNGQAEQMAKKSNSVSDHNPFVESSNWKLIAEARKQSGNKRGAKKASAQAVNYSRTTSQDEQ